MGAWGTGLFDDDLASDIHNVWHDAIATGGSPAEATRAVRDNFEQDCADDYDDGPVFWLALASLQHDAAALESDVAQPRPVIHRPERAKVAGRGRSR